jgi:hypothetical protein
MESRCGLLRGISIRRLAMCSVLFESIADEAAKVFLRNVLSKSKTQIRELRVESDRKKRCGLLRLSHIVLEEHHGV